MKLKWVLLLAGFAQQAGAQTQALPRWRQQVNEWVEKGQWTQALDLLLLRSARSPSAEERRLRAKLLDRLNLSHLERIEWLQLIEEHPSTTSDRNRLAELSLGLGAVEAAGRLLERLPDSSDSVLQKTLLLQYNLQIGRLPRENLRLDLAELNSLPRGWIRHRAQMAQATAYVLSGKVNEALRILNVDVGRGTEFDDSFRHLQRARLLYGQKRFDEALDSVSMVPRSSPSWFGATQVAAWAAYRLGDDNLALGQLMNFHNPYLAAKYSPESWLLQASSLYRLCYLNSASTSLAELESRYGEMAVVLSKFSRELGNRFTGVTTVLGYARGNRRPPAGYGAREWALLMDGLLQNEVLRSTEQFMLSSQQGERQVRGLEQRLGNNARGRFVRAQLQRYGSEIQAARREAVRLGFRALSRRLIELRNDLADVLEASLAVDLEINTRIRDRLLRSDLPAARDLDVDAELADGFDFWPFEGEYWRDEIGSYYFALNSACGETER